MTVLVTFGSFGTDPGPFNLYSNIDGYASPFAIGVTQLQLVGGYASNTCPDGTTTIRVKSTGVCLTQVDLPVGPAPTTTSTTTIPITTTTSTTGAPSILSLAYSGTNTIRGIVTGNFAVARTTGDITGSTNYTATCIFDGSNYVVQRAYFGFNTTPISGATAGNMKINLTINTLVSPTNFVIVRTNTALPSTHVWNTADFAESDGAIAQTNTVNIPPGYTGDVTFTFNATGLAYINGNNDCTFVLVQYPNDHLVVAPLTSAVQGITGANTNVKLSYS